MQQYFRTNQFDILRLLALRLKLNFRIDTSVFFQVKVYIVSSTGEMSICVIFQVE